MHDTVEMHILLHGRCELIEGFESHFVELAGEITADEEDRSGTCFDAGT